MKKTLSLMLMVVIVLGGLGASAINIKNEEVNIGETREFTHAVLAEFGTATWCGYCPYALTALDNIYTSEDYPFYYVSLVMDKNPNACNPRLVTELNIRYLPTVYFDGGAEVIVGGSTGSEVEYRDAIEVIIEREVYDVDIDLNVTWLGGTEMQIDCSVINNEADTYDGAIRVYITEKISSMNWYDYNNDLYTFPLLDYAFDADGTGENISITSGGTWTGSTTWDGTSHGYSSITQDNIMIIAAVFNDDWNQGYANPPKQNPFDAYYIDDTVAAEPGTGENNPPETPKIEGPTEGKAGKTYNYSLCTSDPDGDDIYYIIDWGDGTPEETIGPFPTGVCILTSYKWSEEGTYTIKAKARDTNSDESDWATLEVSIPRNRQVSYLRILRFIDTFPIIQRILSLF